MRSVFIWLMASALVVAATLDSLSQRVAGNGTGIIKMGTTVAADTAYLLGQTTAQTGGIWRCADTSAAAPHSCAMVPAPTVKPNFVVFTPGFSATGGAVCLSINALGCISLVARDGVSDPAANSYLKGVPVVLLYGATLKANAGALVIQ